LSSFLFLFFFFSFSFLPFFLLLLLLLLNLSSSSQAKMKARCCHADAADWSLPFATGGAPSWRFSYIPQVNRTTFITLLSYPQRDLKFLTSENSLNFIPEIAIFSAQLIEGWFTGSDVTGPA